MTATLSKKEKILEAAERMFAEQGYEGTSIRKIAEAAGVSLPLLVHHFKSKDDLFSLVFRTAAGVALQRRQEKMALTLSAAGETSVEDILLAFSDSWIDLWEQEKHTAQLLSQFVAGRPLGHDLVKEMIDPTSEMFLSALENVCPHVERRVVHAYFHLYSGGLVHFHLDRDRIARLSGPDVADTRRSLAEYSSLIGERLRALARTPR